MSQNTRPMTQDEVHTHTSVPTTTTTSISPSPPDLALHNPSSLPEHAQVQLLNTPTIILSTHSPLLTKFIDTVTHSFLTAYISTGFIVEIDSLPPPYPSPKVYTFQRRREHYADGITSAALAGAYLVEAGDWSVVALWETPEFKGLNFSDQRQRPGMLMRKWKRKIWAAKIKGIGLVDGESDQNGHDEEDSDGEGGDGQGVRDSRTAESEDSNRGVEIENRSQVGDRTSVDSNDSSTDRQIHHGSSDQNAPPRPPPQHLRSNHQPTSPPPTTTISSSSSSSSISPKPSSIIHPRHQQKLKPHYHLSFLARNPSRPSVPGSIRAIMNLLFDQARQDHLPVWLEASDPRAIRLYRDRFGFRVVEEIVVGEGRVDGEGWPVLDEQGGDDSKEAQQSGGKGFSGGVVREGGGLGKRKATGMMAWCMIWDQHLR